MDVLEHLPAPLSTMAATARVLSRDGVLLIQTPCYPEGMSYEQLVATDSPFAAMLMPGEHIYLFSRRSLSILFDRIGLPIVVFEPAVFAHYDMCAVGSRRERQALPPAPLTSSAAARLVQALADLSEKSSDLQVRLATASADAAQRLENVRVLETLVASLREESDARWAQVQQLEGLLAAANADAEARLRNAETLDGLLAAARKDSEARLAQVHQLDAWLAEANVDRAARLEQVHQLEVWLNEAGEARDTQAQRATAAEVQAVALEASLTAREDALRQAHRQAAAMLALLEQSRTVLAETRRGGEAALTGPRRPGPAVSRALPAWPTRRGLIAVDLTPVLPGSENGGAKGLVLALLDSLAARREYDYLLLTSARNHEAFASFERTGMTRFCLEAAGGTPPGRIVRGLRKAWTRWRGITGHGRLRSRGVSLLFCPMTDPVHAEAGIPVISVLYDLQHLSYPMFFPPAERAHRDAVYARVKKATDAVICISEFTRQEALSRLGLPAESTHTVPIAVHGRLPEVSTEDVRRVRHAHNLGDAPYLVYPANGWPHKNHRLLLLAFARLLHERPDVTLHLVLTGNLLAVEGELREAADRMGLGDRVHLTGFVSDADLAALWFDAFCLVYPSLFEGFGIPVLEAMRYDVPVVCSDVASLPEVAGEAALLIDPRRPGSLVTALGRLLDEPLLRPTLIAAGRRRLDEFRNVDMAASYARVFSGVLRSALDIREPRIAGLYEDRWLAPQVSIAVGSGAAGRSLTLDVQMPDWHPHSEVSIRVDLPGERRRVTKVARGATPTISVPLPAAPVTIDLHVSPVFVPEGSTDTRRLTLLLLRGRVTSTTGDLLHEF